MTGVETAVPAFIGYTQRAGQAGKELALTPTLVGSLAEFEAAFGSGSPDRTFYLYDSLRLFYDNGGGPCYVVSVGGYGDVTAAAIAAGLDAIERQGGPTMVVVPDALLLPAIDDFGVVVRKMLDQCGRLGDRVAILDVFGADTFASKREEDLTALVQQFRGVVGVEHLSYGMAYFPCLYAPIGGSGNARVVPASGAMAGIYTANDAARGVWTAPANIGVAGVAGPTVGITDALQESLNAPLDGKAVNAIRDFPARGTLVWGARTLDANSLDYRYIQVRRTLVYVEQSIQLALRAYEFAPNNALTWAAVTSMLSNFLIDLWRQGGLSGAKASDAFAVQCGLGTTMTGDDVLEGYLRVAVTLQMIRPAEFIELQFVQEMAPSRRS